MTAHRGENVRSMLRHRSNQALFTDQLGFCRESGVITRSRRSSWRSTISSSCDLAISAEIWVRLLDPLVFVPKDAEIFVANNLWRFTSPHASLSLWLMNFVMN
ncbi:hypothetical protein ACMD2_00671 [Ananas comosus]|uniref:Uncharacterized protein n=1 Tax=Ananas comosus TaxID=4615 RepID=A0A199VCS3_ANACO|nr:hypothetical protein ACMD2_00671 [Ananas comosus]